MPLGRKGADHNVGVPTEWIGRRLRDFLTMPASQLTSALGSAHFQHTRDPGGTVIRAIAVLGHRKSAEVDDMMHDYESQSRRGHFDQRLGLHGGS